MSIVVIGLNHRSSPVAMRERFAFPEGDIPAVLETLRTRGVAREAVILSTCNRVEIYAAVEGESQTAGGNLQDFLLENRGFQEPLNGEIYTLAEPLSLEHLFRVACGLDSMVLGETEVLGQLKSAYEKALQLQATGSQLNRAFQRAFNVAKQIRTDTGIQRGSTSVASVGVELAEHVFSNLAERQVLVIGAGDTAEKAARAMVSRGAGHLVVLNRSVEKAAALAAELKGRAGGLSELEPELAKADIVISSTSSPAYVLTQSLVGAALKQRPGLPLLLIDLAVPRDIDPALNGLDNVYVYNVDDLQEIAESYLQQRRDEIAKCEQIIREKAVALQKSLHYSGASPNA